MSTVSIEQREQALEGVRDFIKECRKELHQIPEIANKEFKTQAYITARLDEMNIEYETHHTGIIGFLPANEIATEKKGAIAFRADMDALPVTEQTSNPHPSTHEGMMHACGHDGHMSMLLGLAKILTEKHSIRTRDVVFIFQPAEENPGGAKILVETGFMQKHKVSEVFGIHVNSVVPEGRLATCAGPMMADNTVFRITIDGTSSHAAMPHMGTDTILAASHLVTQLQQIVSRNTDPHDTAVLSIGLIRGGVQLNVLAKHTYLEGTIRTFKGEVADKVFKRMEDIAAGIARAHNVHIGISITTKYPAVVNDEQLAAEFFELNDNAERRKGLGTQSALAVLRLRSGCSNKRTPRLLKLTDEPRRSSIRVIKKTRFLWKKNDVIIYNHRGSIRQ